MTAGSDNPKVTSIAGRVADRAFVDELYRKHSEALITFLQSRQLSSDDARDIAHEAYCRLVRTRNIASVEYPKAFLFRTAVNLLYDKNRRDLFREVNHHLPLEESELPENSNTSPQRMLESKEKLRHFERALQALSPGSRNVFILHRYEGLTYSEIATYCNISISTVGKHMIKAIAHFDAWMEQG